MGLGIEVPTRSAKSPCLLGKSQFIVHSITICCSQITILVGAILVFAREITIFSDISKRTCVALIHVLVASIPRRCCRPGEEPLGASRGKSPGQRHRSIDGPGVSLVGIFLVQK